ncbi:MAG: dTMP kinase [Hydrogenobacter sp.]|uniref:dTMP kinase n=1 Tax=Hydrogenobacter thermophilus TaxID=940 RepID=UPI0030F55E62
MHLLITFEGIDGSGKTTQANLLYEYLKGRGYSVSLYRDPGSTPLAEKIREVILSYPADPITELLLFEAGRSSLVWEKILPDIHAGRVVIVDRFIDSSIAYQGYGREINLGTVNILNHISTRGIKPDLTFVLNVPIDVALGRIEGKKTKFESPEFLRKVRDAYILLAHSEKNREIHLIDANREKEEVFKDIVAIVERKL